MINTFIIYFDDSLYGGKGDVDEDVFDVFVAHEGVDMNTIPRYNEWEEDYENYVEYLETIGLIRTNVASIERV